MANNYAYLIKVDAIANNNKFYEITENSNGSLDVKYGRIGGHEMTKHYSNKDFYILKNEKERKGYEDRTALHSEKSIDNPKDDISTYKPIENKEVNDLVTILVNSSSQFMKRNYTINSTEINYKMINEAERDIDDLTTIANNTNNNLSSLYYFNKKLQELFTDIPRKMSFVNGFLAQTEADFSKIIQKERDMLDNVKGIIKKSNIIDNKDTKSDKTLLEAFNISVKPVTYKEEDKIIENLGYDYDGRNIENRFVKAFAVENNDTRQAYDNYIKSHNIKRSQTTLLYHGSRTENWASIIKQGLLLNPKASLNGKMFGKGLYFAPDLRKSLNYMDAKGSHWTKGQRDTGYCAIYEIALGKCYKPSDSLSDDFSEKDLPKGTNSVFADKYKVDLNNDEYVIYNQEACTIKYLMEMKPKDARTKLYNFDRKLLRDKLGNGFNKLIKTDTGIKAVLNIQELPENIQNELKKHISAQIDTLNLEVSSPYIMSNITINNNIPVSSLTIDDNEFLTREMKKVFAESEEEWEKIMNEAKDYEQGKEFANIKIVEKELFGVTEGIILQQCNCKGYYGVGLSGAISEAYPEVLDAFTDFNKEYPNADDRLGKHQIVTLAEKEDNKFLAVANLYTQKNFGNSYKSGIKYTDTNKLVENIKAIAEAFPDMPVYIPHSVDRKGRANGIGCGMAGEKWRNLYPLLKELKEPNLYLIDTHRNITEKLNDEIPFNKEIKQENKDVKERD